MLKLFKDIDFEGSRVGSIYIEASMEEMTTGLGSQMDRVFIAARRQAADWASRSSPMSQAGELSQHGERVFDFERE